VSVPNSGRYYVSTAASGLKEEVYLPVYYPDSWDESDAQPIEVRLHSEVAGIDFAVSRSKGVAIRGQLIDGLGRRLPHWDWVWLVARGLGGHIPGSRWRYENTGSYEILGVPPGNYYLCGYRFDDEERVETVIPIEVRGEDLNVDIVSHRSFDLSGRIRFEGARLPLTPPRFTITIRSIDDPTSIVTQHASIRPDTTFSFPPLPAGDFSLSIMSVPPPYFVKSVRLGAIDVLEKGISIRSTILDNLEVVLSNLGSQLTGLVLDAFEKPAPRSYVVLIPETQGLTRPDLYKLAVADVNGQFSITGIAPGDYRVYAWKNLDQGVYFDPEFMKQYEGRGKAIQTTLGSITSVTLQRIDNP
jgi:hypothetical protein